MDSDGDFCRARNQREEQFQQCGVKKTNLLTSILLGASRCEKKTGNVDFKMGPKIWTPLWGPRKEKTIRRTPKRGPDFAPHFKVTLPMFFVA